jgi:hypothetical protein
MSKLLRNKLFYSTFIIFVVLGCSSCFAVPDFKVSAAVDKTEVSLGDLVQLTINIEGLSNSYQNPTIKLPDLEESFAILATAQSSRINMKGSNLEISLQMQYTLTPKNEGDVNIGSAEITYGGKTYNTQEITIKVTPAENPQKQPKAAEPKQVPWREEDGIVI